MVELGESMFQIAVVVHGKKVREVEGDRITYDMGHWLLPPRWMIQENGHDQSLSFESWIIDCLDGYMSQIKRRGDGQHGLSSWRHSISLRPQPDGVTWQSGAGVRPRRAMGIIIRVGLNGG